MRRKKREMWLKRMKMKSSKKLLEDDLRSERLLDLDHLIGEPHGELEVDHSRTM